MKCQVKHPESVVFHIKNSLEWASRTDFNDASFYLLNCSSLDPIMVLCFASFTCVSHFIVSRVLKAWKGGNVNELSSAVTCVYSKRRFSVCQAPYLGVWVKVSTQSYLVGFLCILFLLPFLWWCSRWPELKQEDRNSSSSLTLLQALGFRSPSNLELRCR